MAYEYWLQVTDLATDRPAGLLSWQTISVVRSCTGCEGLYRDGENCTACGGSGVLDEPPGCS